MSLTLKLETPQARIFPRTPVLESRHDARQGGHVVWPCGGKGADGLSRGARSPRKPLNSVPCHMRRPDFGTRILFTPTRNDAADRFRIAVSMISAVSIKSCPAECLRATRLLRRSGVSFLTQTRRALTKRWTTVPSGNFTVRCGLFEGVPLTGAAAMAAQLHGRHCQTKCQKVPVSSRRFRRSQCHLYFLRFPVRDGGLALLAPQPDHDLP